MLPIAIVVGVAVLILAGGMFVALGNLNSSGAPQSITYFGVWRDQTEHAFLALLPQGWTAQGGVRRAYFDADFNLDAKDPTGTMSVYFQLKGYPLFLEPLLPTDLTCRLAPATPDCVEGAYYAPLASAPSFNLLVWRYLSAQQFVTQFILPQLTRAHSDAHVVASNPRPDLTTQTLDMSIAGRSTGADALFSYTVNGVAYREGVTVTTHEASTSLGALWWYDIGGASAPSSDFTSGRNVTRAFSRIIPTVTVNPTWLAQEIQNQAANTQLIQQASERLMQQNYREFTSLSESNEAVGRAWANALGGIEEWQNPTTKESYNVAVVPGADYVWDCGGYSGIARTTVERNPDSSICTEMVKPRH